jgi:hypothetical protein
MELNYHFTKNLQNLLLNFIGTNSNEEDNIDGFGVGAIMPQDMPEKILLTNTESYGV